MRFVVRQQRGSRRTTEGQVNRVIEGLPPGPYMANRVAESVNMSPKAMERGFLEAAKNGKMGVLEILAPDVSGYEDFKKLPEGQKVKATISRYKVYIIKP